MTSVATRRAFGRRVNALFLLLAIVLGSVAVQVYRVVGEFLAASEWVAHSMLVRQEITQTLASLHDSEASQRAYLISGSVERLADFTAGMPAVFEHSRKLQELVADNEVQGKNANRMAALIAARLSAMREVLEVYEQGGLGAARATPQMQRSRTDDLQIDELGTRMLRVEQELLTEHEGRTVNQANLTRKLTVGAILFSVFILGLALGIVRREQRQRLSSMDEASVANEDLRRSLVEAQRLSQTLRQLSELGDMLQGCRSIGEAARGLSVSLPLLLPDISGSIQLINASQNLVETVGQWGGSPAKDDALFAPDDCWALRRGHPYPLAGTIPAFTCKHLEHSISLHPQHDNLCIPMMAQGEILGVVTLTATRKISDVERRNANAACEQISMALANLKLQETLRTQSLRDPLTGLFNRRYLEASLEREVQRAERRGSPLSVLMLDIDHFKRFNDNHGHDAGDALLVQFGIMLARVIRSEDIACRYGGEEFTVLLHETDRAQALERAEQIRLATRALLVEHRRQKLGPVSVSIGLATFSEHGRSPADLLHSADRALYAAKRGGRDQVQVANDSGAVDGAKSAEILRLF
ncbi:MAG: GGDEF domain-containing protein [Dokdonella sp.]